MYQMQVYIIAGLLFLASILFKKNTRLRSFLYNCGTALVLLTMAYYIYTGQATIVAIFIGLLVACIFVGIKRYLIRNENEST